MVKHCLLREILTAFTGLSSKYSTVFALSLSGNNPTQLHDPFPQTLMILLTSLVMFLRPYSPTYLSCPVPQILVLLTSLVLSLRSLSYSPLLPCPSDPSPTHLSCPVPQILVLLTSLALPLRS
jgi:hypothetical protein